MIMIADCHNFPHYGIHKNDRSCRQIQCQSSQWVQLKTATLMIPISLVRLHPISEIAARKIGWFCPAIGLPALTLEQTFTKLP